MAIATGTATLGAAGIGALSSWLSNRSQSRGNSEALQAQTQAQQRAQALLETQEQNRRAEYEERQRVEQQRYAEREARLAPYRQLSAAIIRRRFGGGSLGSILGGR